MTLQQFIYYIKFRLEEEITRIVPVDKGSLKESIKVIIDSDGKLIVKMLDYGLLVEYGTSAMIAAHGPHDPDNPVTSWEAQKKRGAVGQQMPFIRNTFYHKLPKIVKEGAKRYLPGYEIELSFE